MEILNALGVNQTVFIQFGVFVVAYLFLSNLLFKPYFKAFVQRKERTVGKTDLAEKYALEAKELQAKYESKAREINSQYKVIYDQSRGAATKEAEQIVSEARAQTKTLIENNRATLAKEVARVKSDISSEVKGVSAAIQSRLLGREQSL